MGCFDGASVCLDIDCGPNFMGTMESFLLHDQIGTKEVLCWERRARSTLSDIMLVLFWMF